MLPPVLAVIFSAGCATKVAQTTKVHRPDAQSVAYNQFVDRRTAELQQMGGPFKDSGIAAARAQQEAQSRFGDVPPDVSTTWSWGNGNAEAQSEFNNQLEKMARDRPR